MRMTTTTVRSRGAIVLGCLLAIGTLAVLFWDVRAPSDITTDHVMTLAMLVVTIAAGHYWLPAVRQKRVLPAIGLAVLFFARTFVCVTGSAGRGAEVADRKAAAATQVNAARKDAQQQLATAREKREDLAERFVRECGSGKGAKCKGMREALDAQDSHVAVLQVRLDGLQPEQQANVRLKHAARVFAFFRQGADVKRIEEGLELTWPFALALIMELGTIVFLGLGLGHAQQAAPAIGSRAAMMSGKLSGPEIDAARVLEVLQVLGRPVTNAELAAAMGVSAGECSKRVAACNGAIVKHRIGRAVAISLPALH